MAACSDIDGSAGAVEEMERIVGQIRARWPKVKIVLRADFGFAREALRGESEIDYVFGLARNARLEARLAEALAEARRTSQANASHPARVFRDFDWSTKESWSRRRRVIGKAEWTGDEANPRFLVTSLKPDAWRAKPLYEKFYCARGEMENRINECQDDLFADRTSTTTMRANQLRLWFASMPYALICALRRIGLAHTPLANATCGTIRLKLLKLGALVKISARRVKIAFASACPAAPEWRLAAARPALARGSSLTRAAARRSATNPSAHRRPKAIPRSPTRTPRNAPRTAATGTPPTRPPQRPPRRPGPVRNAG